MKCKMSDIQERVLSLYQPNFQYLQTLESTFPVAKGTFVIHPVSYARDQRRGLSGAAGVILFNQVGMTYFAYALINKLIPEAVDFDVAPDGVEDFANNMVIRKFDNLTYRKPILRNQELFFEVSVDSCINRLQRNKILIAELSLNLCNNSHHYKATACYVADKFAREKTVGNSDLNLETQ